MKGQPVNESKYTEISEIDKARKGKEEEEALLREEEEKVQTEFV
jgi:hypothetical protein